MAANRKAPLRRLSGSRALRSLVTGVKQEIQRSGTSESPQWRFTVRGHGPLQQKSLQEFPETVDVKLALLFPGVIFLHAIEDRLAPGMLVGI